MSVATEGEKLDETAIARREAGLHKDLSRSQIVMIGLGGAIRPCDRLRRPCGYCQLCHRRFCRAANAPRLLSRLSGNGSPIAAILASGVCILIAAGLSKLTPLAYNYCSALRSLARLSSGSRSLSVT